MSVAKGTWTQMGVQLIHKIWEGIREFIREGSKGELPMSINSTHILEFLLSLCIKLYFLIEFLQD
jgi:hypothetical protein